MQNDIINTDFVNSFSNSEFVVSSLKDFFSRGLQYNVDLYSPHRLTFFSIVFFIDGKGQHYIDFTDFNYDIMSLFFVCKGQLHAFEKNENANGYILYFTDEFVNRNLEGFSDKLYYKMFNYAINSPKLSILEEELQRDFINIFEVMFREYQRPNDALTEEIIRCQLRTLLHYAERQQEKDQVFFYNHKEHALFIRLQKLIEQKIFESRNSQYYCDELNVSYRKLNNVCKAFTGTTIKHFIDGRIVLEIKRLLSNSNYSIKEICYKTGFDEPTNMTKFFKNQTGILPKEFKGRFC